MKEVSQASGEHFKMMGLCIPHQLLRAPSSWGGSARKQIAKTATVVMNLEHGKEGDRKSYGDLLPYKALNRLIGHALKYLLPRAFPFQSLFKRL